MNIHILGIAGSMTTPLALALIKQGHSVTGSDQEKIFPPTSDLLKNIKINEPLPKKIDLCIVGGSYNKFAQTREEFELIKKNKIPFISATEYLAQNLCREDSILVAGTFGKTSIAGLLSWNLVKANLNPNYFFGGIAQNNFPSLEFSSSAWSVVEADESINGLDTKAKFLYYPVKYLILTSASFEHKDSYKTSTDNFNAFKKLVQNIPKNGLLIANKNGENVRKLAKFSQAPVIFYKNNNEDAVKTMCNYLKINFRNDFDGICRRQQLISKKNNILIFDDFAQSNERIKYTLNTLLKKFPEYNIKVLFEPHASFLKFSIHGLGKSLKSAHEVVLSDISYSKDKTKRITLKNYQKEIGSKLIYLPLKSAIINHYQKTLKPFDLLVRFSSGGNNICQNI